MLIETLMFASVLFGVDAPKTLDHHGATPRRDPRVEIWTNRSDVVHTGQAIRVFFRTDANAYVMVFRVDTDGRAEVLFPHRPWENNFARRDRRYEIRPYGNEPAFFVHDYPGQGYLFAIASRRPFNYSAYAIRDRWDHRSIGYDGRIVGDPYVALMDIIDAVVPRTYTAYDYDVLPYHVERRYEYPRFLCYDCHAYTRYSLWNPYAHTCVRFGIVAYNSPFYYPARVQRANRVVFVRPRPHRLEPRYVFTERHPAEPYIRWMDNRPENDRGERRLLRSRGATGEDFGGVGRVRTPTRDRSIDRDRDRRRNTGGQADRRDANRRQLGEHERTRNRADSVTTRRDPRSTPRRLTDGGRRGAQERNQATNRDSAARRRPNLERRDPTARQPQAARTPERRSANAPAQVRRPPVRNAPERRVVDPAARDTTKIRSRRRINR